MGHYLLLLRNNILISILLISLISSCSTKRTTMSNTKNLTLFEENSNYSASYTETIEFFDALAKVNDFIKMTPFGMTDIGKPLHEVVLDFDQDFDEKKSREKGKAILLINNAIHPGEPCGIDASMMLLRDIAESKIDQTLLKDLVIVMVPIYNIGGALNRGSSSRANQLGPEHYGFRGNAKNLDLNRDFIKCDSKNAESFNLLFNKWNPDVFIDNHTSNGADYQYVMTLIATQKEKLGGAYAEYMENKMLPDLYATMKDRNYEMIPYVYAREVPDEGIAGFLDLARYSSGYAALHNAISFMPETHMLKDYKSRVESTYEFSLAMIHHMAANKTELLKARNNNIEADQKRKQNPINWTMDSDRSQEINFKGFSADYKKSEVTGLSRLYYDRNKPYEKKIPFYNTYKASTTVEKPSAYIIPQAYRKVIDRLQWNGIEMTRLKRDTLMKLEMYYIKDYDSRKSPYEGHYLHSNVSVEKKQMEVLFMAGDVVVKTGQKKDRYIVETLEPQAPDSFFAWNFFDGILMQKEHFSAYVFEDLAKDILDNDANLKKQFNDKRESDEAFRNDAYAQLNYIYKHSKYYEPTYKRYPVGRIMN